MPSVNIWSEVGEMHSPVLHKLSRKLPHRSLFSLVFGIICLGVTPSYAKTPPAYGKCPLLDLAAANRPPTPAAPDTPHNTENCLVAASLLDSANVDILDLRNRAQFVEFHVPGAKHATVTELITQPQTSDRQIIVYDGGKFRSDAAQLCGRLSHVGIGRIQVVDGGIAAWAQLHELPETMALNRLADHEIASALNDPKNDAIALDPLLRPLTAESKAHQSRRPDRLVILGTPGTPPSEIRMRLKADYTTLYWIGAPERLRELVNVQLKQDEKRLAGPAVSKTCSAL